MTKRKSEPEPRSRHPIVGAPPFHPAASSRPFAPIKKSHLFPKTAFLPVCVRSGSCSLAWEETRKGRMRRPTRSELCFTRTIIPLRTADASSLVLVTYPRMLQSMWQRGSTAPTNPSSGALPRPPDGISRRQEFEHALDSRGHRSCRCDDSQRQLPRSRKTENVPPKPGSSSSRSRS